MIYLNEHKSFLCPVEPKLNLVVDDDERIQTNYHNLKHRVNESCGHKTGTGKSLFLKADILFLQVRWKKLLAMNCGMIFELEFLGQSDNYKYAHT